MKHCRFKKSPYPKIRYRRQFYRQLWNRRQFSLPTSVIIDSRGYLYINERGNERVQKFDANGNPILMWGSKGSGPNQFCHVEHLAVDRFDNIYVTDPQSDPGCSNEARISKFDSNGHFITQWKLFGVQAGVSNLDPEHMAIDSEGNIYVSEELMTKFKSTNL